MPLECRDSFRLFFGEFTETEAYDRLFVLKKAAAFNAAFFQHVLYPAGLPYLLLQAGALGLSRLDLE